MPPRLPLLGRSLFQYLPYSTMASKQPALDFLSFVNASPTRMALLSTIAEPV